MPATLDQFVELCERLAGTGSKLQKRALMAEYLRELPVPEAGLAALYLAGAPFAETDGRELKVGGALLSRVLAQLSGASPPAMHAAYLRHGDLGGAARDLLEARNTVPTLTLPDIADAFAAIAGAGKPAAKQQITLGLFAKGHTARSQVPDQDHPGRYATGIKVSLVEEAIAAAYSAAIGEVRNARMLNGNPPGGAGVSGQWAPGGGADEAIPPLGFHAGQPGRDGGGGAAAVSQTRWPRKPSLLRLRCGPMDR